MPLINKKTRYAEFQSKFPSIYDLQKHAPQDFFIQEKFKKGTIVKKLDNIGFGFCGDFSLMAMLWFCGKESYSIRAKLKELISNPASLLYHPDVERQNRYIRSLGTTIPETDKLGSIQVRDLEINEMLAIFQHERCCNVVLMLAQKDADGKEISVPVFWSIDDRLSWCVLHMALTGERDSPLPPDHCSPDPILPCEIVDPSCLNRSL